MNSIAMDKKPSRNIYIQRDVAIHAASFKRARVTIQNARPLKGESVKYTNLLQVWHGNDETPLFDACYILAGGDGGFDVYDREAVFGISDPGGVYLEASWKEFVENYGIRRWAYIEDLLPSRQEKRRMWK